MSNGGYKGASPARETSPEQYPGVWELTEQFQAQADGNWPFQETDCAPKSLRFETGDSPYLEKTFSAAGNRRVFTWSGWVKKCHITDSQSVLFSAYGGSGNAYLSLDFRHDQPRFVGWSGSSVTHEVKASAKLRDPSAWYSIVWSVNTNEPTDADKVKLFINGVRQTQFETTNYPSTGDDLYINNAIVHEIGRNVGTSQAGFDGLMSQIHFIDGQALSCDEFGFFNGQGIWMPKRFTGDYSSGPVYSNFSNANGVVASGSLSNLFDSSTSTYVQLSQSSTDYAIATQEQAIPVSSSIGMWTLTGASNPTLRITETNGTVTVLDYNDATIQNNTWTDFTFTGTVAKIEVGYLAGSGSSNNFYGLRVDGIPLQDASVGRNSFKLDFSDGVKDQSGLGNDWTGNNIGLPGGNVIRTSELSENHSSGSVAQPFNAFNATYISSKINTSTWAITSTAWVGSYSAAYAELRWIPTGGYAVSNSLRVYYGCYDNTAKTTTLTITYTDGSTETDSMTSGNNNWMKLFTASNAAGKTVQKVELSPSTPSATNLQFGGFVIDNAIVESSNPDSDFFVDSPVNGNEASTAAGGERRGNYCTWSPIDSTGTNTLSNGNLDCSGAQRGNRGTIAVTSGKYYYETVITSFGVGGDFGWSKSDKPCPTTDPGANSYGWSVHTSGLKRHNGSTSSYISGGFAAGDVIQFAIDVDAGKVWFGKNNTWGASGDPAAGTNAAFTNVTGPIAPAHGNGGSAIAFTTNFGSKSFSYAPPAGFSPIATSFMPEPTIKRGDEAMDVALWTGNNSTNKIGNLRLSPDLVWIKARSPYALNHELYDTVRGAGNLLRANTAGLEVSATRFSSFDSDGFTLNGSQPVNGLNETHVGWVWDAGDATTTIAAGSLNSSAYNRSQVWSTYGTNTGTTFYPAITQLFDNDLTTGPSTPANSSATWTFTSGITASSSIEIYCSNGSGPLGTQTNGTEIRLTVDGTVHSVNGAPGWIDTGLKGSLTAITIFVTAGSGSSGLRAIKVDGRELVDNGVSVANVPLVATDVRARTDAGFSIAKWSKSANNQSYAHGLSQAPEFIIAKSLDGAHSWRVWHKDLSNNKNTLLDTNQAEDTYTDMLGIPDAYKVPLIGGGPGATDGGMIAYNFHSVEGYCQIGSFINPSSTEGAFVFCGFRPALIIGKCVKNISSSSGAGDWIIKDSARSPFNNPSDGNTLVANVDDAEDSYYAATQAAIDILSNGFKIRHPNSSPLGDPGRLFVFAAWAENPFASNCRAC